MKGGEPWVPERCSFPFVQVWSRLVFVSLGRTDLQRATTCRTGSRPHFVLQPQHRDFPPPLRHSIAGAGPAVRSRKVVAVVVALVALLSAQWVKHQVLGAFENWATPPMTDTLERRRRKACLCETGEVAENLRLQEPARSSMRSRSELRATARCNVLSKRDRETARRIGGERILLNR